MPAVWTPPLTWQVDQLVTEADLNQQVRDNLSFLYAGLTGYIFVCDQKAQSTPGGTFTSGAWQVRELLASTLVDPGGHAAVASNQLTLAAGTYRCLISCPAGNVFEHQARLYNVSDNTPLLLGTSVRNPTPNMNIASVIMGRFTLAASKLLEIQHRCNTTATTNGFGIPANLGTEIYTVAQFWKEA